MTWILILKLLVVVIFLLIFLRRPSVTWGVGLLTVTSAVLLDTLLGTFSAAAMEASLGFFYFVIAGALFGGAAVWLWGLLRPLTARDQAAAPAPAAVIVNDERSMAEATPQAVLQQGDGAFDQQMLYDDIRKRFGREDVLDLMFDLGINENEVMTIEQNMSAVIVNIMNLSTERGQTAALALAVERILTPPPPEHLPRLEKIHADSPPTILRQYLLAHYDLAQLQAMAAELGVDWEELGTGGKKQQVRELLLYLYRRNRVPELVALMQEQAAAGITDNAD